jgi:DNA (cytosine-5)-methyltransferase 1
MDPIGGECVFVSEIDSAASSVYSKNWLKNSDISVAGDIKELTKNVNKNIPNHDVLTAGLPCQPFSKSGHQLGVNEARGTLFYNILQIIEEKKPKIILLENVRNLVGPKHYKDYLIIIKLLRKLGYAVSDEPTILSPHEIPTRFGGTPQHRDRVFIGAVKVGETRAKELIDLGPLLPRQPFKKYGEIIWDIHKTLNEYGVTPESNKTKISKEKINALKMWNEFLYMYREFNNSNPPGLPLWSDYWDIRKNVKISKSVPDWKRQFILRNIEIYEENMKWINTWRKKYDLSSHIASNRKFEWQGRNQEDIYKCLIQLLRFYLRASKTIRSLRIFLTLSWRGYLALLRRWSLRLAQPFTNEVRPPMGCICLVLDKPYLPVNQEPKLIWLTCVVARSLLVD